MIEWCMCKQRKYYKQNPTTDPRKLLVAIIEELSNQKSTDDKDKFKLIPLSNKIHQMWTDALIGSNLLYWKGLVFKSKDMDCDLSKDGGQKAEKIMGDQHASHCNNIRTCTDFSSKFQKSVGHEHDLMK